MASKILLSLSFLLSCVIWANALNCPDGNQCSDASTCCPTTNGYACCPYFGGSCCADMNTCCKPGFRCFLNMCVPVVKKNPLFVAQQVVTTPTPTRPPRWGPSSNTQCPDGSTCPAQATCCLIASNLYGCCPMPNAVCCQDHQHCCPSGTVCDVAHQTCNTPSNLDTHLMIETSKWAVLRPRDDDSDESVDENDVSCDSSSSCPDGTTCCKLPDDSWGCCPFPNAVCCDDKIHCCPNGLKCGAGRCEQGVDVLSETVPWTKQTVSLTSQLGTRINPGLKSVVCPDQQSQCPDDNTCCKLASGDWGCCPLPNATCCEDHAHCCPHGNTCSGGRCYPSLGRKSIPWFKKTKATPIPRFNHSSNAIRP